VNSNTGHSDPLVERYVVARMLGLHMRRFRELECKGHFTPAEVTVTGQKLYRMSQIPAMAQVVVGQEYAAWCVADDAG
jgi:hypothetical protein